LRYPQLGAVQTPYSLLAALRGKAIAVLRSKAAAPKMRRAAPLRRRSAAARSHEDTSIYGSSTGCPSGGATPGAVAQLSSARALSISRPTTIFDTSSAAAIAIHAAGLELFAIIPSAKSQSMKRKEWAPNWAIRAHHCDQISTPEFHDLTWRGAVFAVMHGADFATAGGDL
jgi:hypothetical protein